MRLRDSVPEIDEEEVNNSSGQYADEHGIRGPLGELLPAKVAESEKTGILPIVAQNSSENVNLLDSTRDLMKRHARTISELSAINEPSKSFGATLRMARGISSLASKRLM